jgi:hypothetical protein
VCSDQQLAELSAFVVIWATDLLISEEVYWQQFVLPQEQNSGLVWSGLVYIDLWNM